jgi:hypothetical protein
LSSRALSVACCSQLRPMWEHNNSRRLASPGAGSTRSVSAPTAASVTASERVGGVGELRSSAEGLPDADKSEEDILGPIRSWYSFMNLLRSAKVSFPLPPSSRCHELLWANIIRNIEYVCLFTVVIWIT